MSLSPSNTEAIKGQEGSSNQLQELIAQQHNQSPSHCSGIKNEEDFNSYTTDEESNQVSDEMGHPFLHMKSNDCYEPAWMSEVQSHSFDDEQPVLQLLKIENMSPHDKEISRPWHCEFCPKSFHLKHHLVGHLRTHSGEKPYQCMVCFRPFADRSSMNRHTKMHTACTNEVQNRSFDEEEPQLDLFKIQNLLPKDKEATKPWNCEFCSKSFHLKHHLIGHLRTHSGEKPYQCMVCLRPFADRSSMNRHAKIHNGLKPSFLCRICGHSFSDKYYLIIHNRSHSGERPYSCDICHKNFTRKDTLNMHLKSHTKERPYSCEICKKTYTFKHHLVIHARNHSGERPFQCVTCTKAFTDRSSFNRHIKLYCRVSSSAVNFKSKHEQEMVEKSDPDKPDYVQVNIESSAS